MSSKSAAVKYMKSWFILDLASSIPFDIFMAGMGNTRAIKAAKIAKVLKVVRLLKLSKGSAFLDLVGDLLTKNRPLVQIASMLMAWFTMSHFAACMFAFVGTFGGECQVEVAVDGICENDQVKNWFNDYSPADWHAASYASQYLTCFYWACTVITTLGYGDILPVTQAEVCYTMGVMLIGEEF